MSARTAGNERLVGFGEAVAASSLWGTSGIFSVHLFRLGVPPETVALVRPLVGGAFLAAAFGLTRPRTLLIDTRGLLILGVGGGAAVGSFQIAYQLSTDAVGVPTTVALLYLAPALVVAAAGPLLDEWPGRRRVVLAALTVGGVWLSALGADRVPATFGSSGFAWGLLAATSYATYTLLGRFAVPRYGAARTVIYSTVGACAWLALSAVLTGPPTLPGTAGGWLLLVAFGALTIGLAQLLFFDALGRIEASGASIATAAEPAVGAMLAAVLLSQGMKPVGWIGIGLVVAGVIGVGLPARSRPAPTDQDAS